MYNMDFVLTNYCLGDAYLLINLIYSFNACLNKLMKSRFDN
jgi:hypothetical protein